MFDRVLDGGLPTTIGVEGGLTSRGLVLAAETETVAAGLGDGRTATGVPEAVDAVAGLFTSGKGAVDLNEIAPLCQTFARLSLSILSSIMARLGFAGPGGSIIGFPLILSCAICASDFE